MWLGILNPCGWRTSQLCSLFKPVEIARTCVVPSLERRREHGGVEETTPIFFIISGLHTRLPAARITTLYPIFVLRMNHL